MSYFIRKLLWTGGCLLFAVMLAEAAPLFATLKLQALAERLALPGLETLGEGEYTSFKYQGRTLIVRVNEWQEVEHIGYRLFADEQKKALPSPAYDFLERYFLELELAQGTEQAIRIGLDKVKFEEGQLSSVTAFDGTETFELSFVSFRAYRAVWKRGDQPVLSVSFDMDYQLLTSCNAIELEQWFVRRVKRWWPSETDDRTLSVPRNTKGTIYIRKGEQFLAKAIRNDLCYAREKDGSWRLLSDPDRPRLTLANMMLSPDTQGDYQLELTVDKYGYQEEEVSVRLRQWMGLCLAEGCNPYFGLKGKQEEAYTGTVFMVNETGGYLHMLSVEVPEKVIGTGSGTLKGRLYVYIPLFNVAEGYFNLTDYEEQDENN